MPSLAFATYRRSPEMTDDDRLVADALRRRGVAVTSTVWDDSRVHWHRFDAVVIRSTWDYHLALRRYAEWVGSFRDGATRLWNPPEAVLRNLNKAYLPALTEKGVETVPTVYLAASETPVLREVLEARRWNEAVIKPAVSASAWGTWRTSLATAAADQTRFAEQARTQDILVQPYLPEVASQGEWSLVFFGGRYSHAALKRPVAGDFRVQHEFGGSAVPAVPDDTFIDQARSALSAVGQELLYARVDGIEREGRLVVMELEINEPYLYLSFSESFAEATMHVLTAARRT